MDERARKAVDPDKTRLTTTIRDFWLYQLLFVALKHLPTLSVQVVDHRKVLITAQD